MEHRTKDQIFVIRLCVTQREGLRRYRVSLANAHTGDHLDFPDLDSFINFLRTQEATLAQVQVMSPHTV